MKQIVDHQGLGSLIAVAEESPVPKAYKVLGSDGGTPWANDCWSLPRQKKDGSWIPGAWKKARRLPFDAIASYGEGVYVTTQPLSWRSQAPSNVVGPSAMQIFEVEIGDQESIEAWQDGWLDRYDFPAQRARLLRPISDEELSILEAEQASRSAQAALDSERHERSREEMRAKMAELKASGVIKSDADALFHYALLYLAANGDQSGYIRFDGYGVDEALKGYACDHPLVVAEVVRRLGERCLQCHLGTDIYYDEDGEEVEVPISISFEKSRQQ